MKEEDKNKVDV